MRWLLLLSLSVTLSYVVVGQTPPQPLPRSIIGGMPPTAVVPTSANMPVVKQPPIARFQSLTTYPPETVQAVFGMRTGAEWLVRMHQVHGRFMSGLLPAVKLPLEKDNDFHQAQAALAVCQAARFTGDDKLHAVAQQSVLSLLALTKDDPADNARKIITAKPVYCQLGFAAVLAMAIYELPGADANTMGEAQKLCAYVRSHCQSDGSIGWEEKPEDTDLHNLYPGLALQALAVCYRANPDPATKDVLTRGLSYYRSAFRKQPHPVLAGTVIPAAVDYVLTTPDREVIGMVFEMADWLCANQLGKAHTQQVLWVGGFRLGIDSEPGFDTAYAVRGLASAVQLIRQQEPDVTRYTKYRQALVDAIGFVRGLQFTLDNSDHFEGRFRAHYLIGGVRLSPSDGTLRIDATATAVSAYLRFLESGAETRE